MTSVLPELEDLTSGLVLDGELVAWRGSEPYFPLVCRRVLNRDMSIPLTFVIFESSRTRASTSRRVPMASAAVSSSASGSTGPAWTTWASWCQRIDPPFARV